MANNSYYFSHDGNARNDEKILMLRSEHGWEGYGVFWALVEMMFEKKDTCLNMKRLNGIASGLGVDPDKLKAIVETCIEEGLFEKDGEEFWSNTLCRRKEKLENLKSRRSEGGKKGMASRWSEGKNDNSVISELEGSYNSVISDLEGSNNSDITPDNKGKERKGKKKDGSSKEERSNEKPADTTVVREYYVERYKHLFGCEPLINYGKDMKNLKTMIDHYGVKRMKQIIELYFRDDDRLARENSYSLSFLITKVNKYATQLSGGGSRAESEYTSVDEYRKKKRKTEAL